jgi:hypothetical protein
MSDPTDSDPTGESEPKPLRTVDDQARAIKIVVALGLVAAALWFFFGRDDDGSDTSSAALPSVRTITYHVTGTANAVDITIETPTGVSQQNGLDVPLTNRNGDRGLTATFSSGDFVYIAAQNAGERGTVRCSIEDETGLTISENVARGAYAIATCEGRA